MNHEYLCASITTANYAQDDPKKMMPPLEAITSSPPNVWLTSFYGFDPGEWGLLPFTNESYRTTFLKRTKPGVLIVVYGASGCKNTRMRRNIIGIQQCSHQVGHAQKFMSPSAWENKRREGNEDKWNYGVKAVRAWRVAPESYMPVDDFAPDAAETGAWLSIGALGMLLTLREASNILNLELQECDVYGETPIIGSVSTPATELFTPSKAGPVSQSSYAVREAEGPKHLYILKLHGDANAFLGRDVQEQIVIKAGFSKNPQSRCADFNRAFPQCAFRWEVLYSGAESGYDPHPSSNHAKAGERAMQTVLCDSLEGRSLGGEFFLATPELIANAWHEGNEVAAAYSLGI